MERRKIYTGTAVRGGAIRGSVFGLGLVGLFLAGGKCAAQDSTKRLTVRPHAMATGTRTDQAGWRKLKGDGQIPDPSLYVPQQCVGTRRCPLFVFLGVWEPSALEVLRPAMDQYGMILFNTARFQEELDVLLKHILQTFAIDPDKRAIIGRCHSTWPALAYGQANLDIFSRIVWMSGAYGVSNGVNKSKAKNEFLVVDGVLDTPLDDYILVPRLRRDEYPTKFTLRFRNHDHQIEDYMFVARWLHESWATPDPAARPAPQVVADPVPLLTTEALTKMTAFWTRFMQEPDSIKTAARRAHLREVTVPFWEEQSSIPMVDIAALAAKHPSVARALQEVGLSAQQHEAYRVALVSAHVMMPFDKLRAESPIRTFIKPVAPTSVLAKNLAFMQAHPDELKALEATGMWLTP